MRTIRNIVQAEKARREENGDEGFSLIELIVVVVILGILAAVAIPVFLGLQGQAEQSAQDSVAANAATQAAADFANGSTPAAADFANLNGGGTPPKYAFAIAVGPSATSGATLDLDTFCVTVTGPATDASTAGPGC